MKRVGVAGLLAAAVVVAGAVPALAADPLISDACPADEVQPVFYSDSAGAHEQGITCIAWWGITGGVEPGVYGSDRPASRAQMATFLARLLDGLGVELPAPAAGFTDIAGTTHEESIRALATAGIVAGGGDGRYRPADPVSRAQMATFLVRAYEYALDEPLPPAPDRFADDTGSVHEPNINRAAQQGWAAGVAGGGFAPAASVRRDQMASFLARLLGTGVRQLPGGRDNPIPAGEPIPLVGDWVLEVLAADSDGTDEVLAENPFNEPPAAGRQYVLVRVRATYEGGGSARLGASDLRLLGRSGSTYGGFSDRCGVVPDAVDDRETFRGGTIEGNLCFSVPTTDVAGLLVYDADWEGDVSTRLYGEVFAG